MTILTHPHPILRQKAQEIDFGKVELKRLEKLSKSMIKTMYKADGVGLAAPQIGESLQLCIISKHAAGDDLILINPLIIARSVEVIALEEGCLSLPGSNVLVNRPRLIKLKARDLKGNTLEFEARDFFSRVIQHEVDHLEGILIIDHET